MAESNAPDVPKPPSTMLSQPEISDALRQMGLQPAMTVLAHCSMSKLGWINGGVQALAGGILDVLGPQGTLMVPTHTATHTEPSFWRYPPVPKEWWETIRRTRPAFDPDLTPSQSMGALAEFVRTHPRSQRSGHPVGSFAAIGPKASALLGDHHLDDSYGDRSPLGRLYEMDGHLLFLGVNHENNTSLHLSEARCDYPGKNSRREGTAMLVGGRRQWVTFDSEQGDSDDFAELGRQFHAATDTPVFALGEGEAYFMRQRAVVDYGVEWLRENRKASSQAGP